METTKKTRVRLTEVDRKNIIALHDNDIPAKVIAEKYGCSVQYIYDLSSKAKKKEKEEAKVVEEVVTEEPVVEEKEHKITTVIIEENSEMNKEKEEESEENKGLSWHPFEPPVMNRKMRRMAAKEAKKSKNKHQMKKERNKELGRIYNQAIDDFNAANNNNEQKLNKEEDIVEVENESGNYEYKASDCYITIGDTAFSTDEFNITRLHKPTKYKKYNFVRAGLVSNRHKMPVSNYIFEGPIPKDIILDQNHALYDIAVKYIVDNLDKDDTLVLYTTGCQAALSAVFAACLDCKINLVTMNCDEDNDYEYIPQVVIKMFNGSVDIDQVLEFIDYDSKPADYPFNRLLGNPIYLYDCTLDEVLEANEPVSISINNNNYWKDNEIEDSTYIIATSPDKVWGLYGKIINIIQGYRDKKKMSVFMTTIDVTSNSFGWGVNISKSYNFK